MADKDFEVKASAKTVANEKTKQQAAEAAATKKKMAEAAEKAEEARAQAAKEKAAKPAGSPKKADSSPEELLTEGAGIAASLLKSVGSTPKKGRSGGFLRGLVIGLIIGALAMGFLGFTLRDKLFGAVGTTKETADKLLDEGFLGYTAADFQDAVLGAASEHQELIVMEQPLSISTTITKAGLGNLAIFSKVKTVTYYGTGVYTVNMQGIDKDHIAVDAAAKTVTVTIPHAALQYINPDLSKTEFEDTEKGLLAFGDLALTAEQQNELQKSVQAAMKERLDSADLYAQADEYAQMKTWEIFQPLVTAVSPEYKVVMQFADSGN